MVDPFVHLRTVSSFSLRHGVSTPEELVNRAAELGQRAIALTDRDGLYGAVRFAQACRDAGVGTILGVDLAVVSAPDGSAAASRPRTPVRGGAAVWESDSRVVVLARGGRGWAALCRLVSAVHLTGERGRPAATAELIAEYVRHGDLIVTFGADSVAGQAVARRRPDLAAAELRWWLSRVGPAAVRVEVASHRSSDGLVGQRATGQHPTGGVVRSARAAAGLLMVAEQCGVAAVLSNAVRYSDAARAPVADTLDAIRRLVPLDLRHLDRANAQGYLKNWEQMRPVVAEIAAHANLGSVAALGRQLLDATVAVAEECLLDPIADVGLGDIHVPELDVVRRRSGRGVGGSTAVGDVLAGYDSRRRSRAVIDDEAAQAHQLLRSRCEAELNRRGWGHRRDATDRLTAELATIADLGFAGYFLTVAEVVDLIRELGVRAAARGSGAGSLVNHLLGISGVDPLRHDLLMERFLSPLRRSLPDIDVDVESARRPEVYEHILARFGGDRCTCVSMRDTYRVRHAIRDVGAALGMPPGEVDTFAKSFPHIRAAEVRSALKDLPELRGSGVGRLAAAGELDVFLDLVESLDGLPRHIAVHPCGVLLSDATMLDRTPVEASWQGFPMSQFDKDEVEALGFLKLDVLGIRMQSALQHAVAEVRRVDDSDIALDELPLDDPATFELIRSTRTLGCFQIESPGQRELLGKFAPETFDDIIIDISLFRPGPVKSDMITPFLAARQGWAAPEYIHEDLRPALTETYGVVVYHEQVLRIVSVMTGCSYAEADEVRRSMGSPDGQQQVRGWFYRLAHGNSYDVATIEATWEVLRAFASFGFCKAHAAAFALPTYHSAWLKTHHPAAFYAGVLTHDPGMYPKRLILDDARHRGIEVLPLDINRSGGRYHVERDDTTGRYGIRLALSEVKGISDAEVASIMAGQPYGDLPDFWGRSGASRSTVEGLIVTGGFDSVYGITVTASVDGQRRLTRRDLLLQTADLDRLGRLDRRQRGGKGRTRPVAGAAVGAGGGGPTRMIDSVAAARRQSQAPAVLGTQPNVQLSLDLGESCVVTTPSGLPEMTPSDRVQAELAILGLDASAHLIDFYAPMLSALGATRSTGLLDCRSGQEIVVGGVKVATQTPPIRTGHRVVFLTLDDGAGPIDATFFPDVQDPYAQVVFGAWLLMVRGRVRRTGPKGVSLRATGCWDLTAMHRVWLTDGAAAVAAIIADSPRPAERGRSASPAAGRVWQYASGFRKSPYADIRPAGGDVANARGITGVDAAAAEAAPAKLWHSSHGSPGR